MASIPQPNYAQYGFNQPQSQMTPQGPSQGQLAGLQQQVTSQYPNGAPPVNRGNYQSYAQQQQLGIGAGTMAEDVLARRISSGATPSSAVADLLKEFPTGTSPRHLKQWFQDMSPILAQTLFQSPGYGFLQDPSNWDGSQQAYSQGAGIMGQAATQALNTGQNQLARMGLGRSGAQAGLASQVTQQLGAQQGDLFSRLYQQSIENRLSGARQAFDLDQAIMQLAMGQSPSVPARQKTGMGLEGAIAGSLGSGIGSLLGGWLGGLGSGGGAAGAGAAAGAGPTMFAM